MAVAVVLALVVLVISLLVELGQRAEARRRRSWELVWQRGWTVRRDVAYVHRELGVYVRRLQLEHVRKGAIASVRTWGGRSP